MKRRSWLKSIGGGISLIAGCTGSDEPDIKDSDGDGVIDSQDYAPNDPEVQEKSDLIRTDTITPSPTASPTRSPTQTPTETPSPTPSPTSKKTSDSNKQVVDDEYWQDTSRIVSFGTEEVTVIVEPETPETNSDPVKLYVGLDEFPRSEIIDESLSSAFTRSGESKEITVEVEPGDLSSVKKYSYLAGLVPSTTQEDDVDYAQLTTIMETDPFEVKSDGTIERASYEAELDDDSGSNYSRNNIEGAYQLKIDGRTSGKDWTVSFFAYKSAHAVAVDRSRGRSRSEYVSFELSEGTGEELGTLLKNNADSLEFSEYEAVEFAIDFVQALPYVPDDVSKGFDDYTKFIMETMPELGGDCEDTSIMLASVLESEAFFYDMILIQPPGHMAVGIYQSDPAGWYWELDGRKYSYIETTGQGWGIGDCPEDYQGTDAYLHQV